MLVSCFEVFSSFAAQYFPRSGNMQIKSNWLNLMEQSWTAHNLIASVLLSKTMDSMNMLNDKHGKTASMSKACCYVSILKNSIARAMFIRNTARTNCWRENQSYKRKLMGKHLLIKIHIKWMALKQWWNGFWYGLPKPTDWSKETKEKEKLRRRWAILRECVNYEWKFSCKKTD